MSGEVRFRDVLGSFASGVTVITVATPDGHYGMTASAFSSLSLEPPLVLVCVGKENYTHGLKGISPPSVQLANHAHCILQPSRILDGGDRHATFLCLDHQCFQVGHHVIDRLT